MTPPVTLADLYRAVYNLLYETLPRTGSDQIEVKWGNWYDIGGPAVLISNISRIYTPDQFGADRSLQKYAQTARVTLTCTSGPDYPTPEAADVTLSDILERVLDALGRGDDEGLIRLESDLPGIEEVVLESIEPTAKWDEVSANRSSAANLIFAIRMFAG